MMKRVMPWMLVLFVVGLVSCSPKADDVDDTEHLINVSDLPVTIKSGSVFFMVNGVELKNYISTPYSFRNATKDAFVPSVGTVDVVSAMVASGVYFAPPRASEGAILAYNTSNGDSLTLNYRTGEMWTKLDAGDRIGHKQLTRSNGKDFMDWSVSDPEIESLNLSLSNAGKTPLVAGDEVRVTFVIISDNANGAYLQNFTLKSYTLK